MTGAERAGDLIGAPLRVLRGALARPRLLRELVRRDIRARFAGSRFGLLWTVVNPLIQLVSYALIFGFVYRGGSDQPRGAFLASLFCGLWPWWGFQDGVTHGMTALVDQAPLLRKTPLPPALCVLGQVGGSFLLQSLGFLLFLAVFALAGIVPVDRRLLLLPLAMLLGLALTAGVAVALAPLQLVVRDTMHVVVAALTVLFFASPVLYRVESLPPIIQGAARWNPIAGLIDVYRSCVLGTPLAPASLISCVVGVAGAWIAAGWLSDRLDPYLDEYW